MNEKKRVPIHRRRSAGRGESGSVVVRRVDRTRVGARSEPAPIGAHRDAVPPHGGRRPGRRGIGPAGVAAEPDRSPRDHGRDRGAVGARRDRAIMGVRRGASSLRGEADAAVRALPVFD